MTGLIFNNGGMNVHEKKVVAEGKTIIIVGNPNVGKSVIYNHLTGGYATVSNYPGTTIDISSGIAQLGKNQQKYAIMDTPGVNSLIPHSEDEEIARNLLLKERPDIVIQIADAKNLRRALHLTLELAELEFPIVLCLNMFDEAMDRGLRIDLATLEKLLGVPVVATVAITRQGILELKARVSDARDSRKTVMYSTEIEKVISQIEGNLPPQLKGKRGIAIMLLSGDTTIYSFLQDKIDHSKLINFIKEKRERFIRPISGLVFEYRERDANEIVSQVQTSVGVVKSSIAEKISRFLMRPLTGYLALIFILAIMYLFVGQFAAGDAVDFIEGKIFGEYLNPFFIDIIKRAIPVEILRDFLVGEYGLITMALTYSIAIILPIVTAFFLFFGFLEDTGYLPRLSVMLDRIFRSMGLNGKAVLPMVLGLGCDTMAVLTARILDTKKERLIVSILLALAVPCSAQLSVILAMLSGLSFKALFIWLFVILFFLFFTGKVASVVLPGAASPFLVEIPPIRVPTITNILIKVKMRLLWYLKEAVPLFILGTSILFVLDKANLLRQIETVFSPVVVRWAGLPEQTTQAFILGFLRRDYGAAGLLHLAKDGILNPKQIVVSLVIITLFVPCIAQFFVTIRERGKVNAILIFLFCMTMAFLVGGILNNILNLVNII